MTGCGVAGPGRDRKQGGKWREVPGQARDGACLRRRFGVRAAPDPS